ncbi:hypothetical protein NKG05_28685 [Oerskovia sp. M15]
MNTALTTEAPTLRPDKQPQRAARRQRSGRGGSPSSTGSLLSWSRSPSAPCCTGCWAGSAPTRSSPSPRPGCPTRGS